MEEHAHSPAAQSPAAMPPERGADDLAPEVVASAQRAVLAWLATADAGGCPNVSPKEVFAVVDDRVFVVAHIASPTSVRNLSVNAQACLSFVDVFVQKGFKVKGRTEIVARSHPDFAHSHWSAPLERLTGGRFPIHAVIVLHPRSVEPIVAPSYRLFPSRTSEASQAAAAMQAYGVRPARRTDDDARQP